MTYTQEDLELVARHVAQAERNVSQQRSIVAELKTNGYPTSEALVTLATLDASLLTLRQRLIRIHLEVIEQSPESVT